MILLLFSSKVRNLLRKCFRSTASPLCFRISHIVVVQFDSQPILTAFRIENWVNTESLIENYFSERFSQFPQYFLAQYTFSSKISQIILG